VAAAAVLGGLTVALTLVGWFVPHASVVSVLAVLPMGVIAHRYRPRAVVASTFATIVATFLVAGTGPLATVVSSAAIGGLVGDARRRGWGYGRTMVLGTFVLGPAFSLAVDGSFSVFASLRKLTLDQLRNSLHGASELFAAIPPLAAPARWSDRHVNLAIHDWWITLPIVLVLYACGVTSLTWQIMVGVLTRLDAVPPPDLLDGDTEGAGLEAGGIVGGPGPVPSVLSDVTYRYAGASADALRDVSLSIEPGRLVAVLGDNGSGKSTLLRILAGRSPTSGAITRPGRVGLGSVGGTAVVSQRPETQVLGVLVADDLVWGLPPGSTVDVEALLTEVGLAGMANRETATLSGGELQRVALAAALARRPQLLLSDESTAMVDAEGRLALTTLFGELPERTGMTVVHVTHRMEEVTSAGVIFRLDAGRLVEDRLVEPHVVVPSRQLVETLVMPTGSPQGTSASPLGASLQEPPAAPVGGVPAPGGRGVDGAGARSEPQGEHRAQPVLRVSEVSHTYAARTAWPEDALLDVSFDIGDGEGVLIVGGNGSGKSTLAWIMAGLLWPTGGSCALDGAPVGDQRGRVSLAFQHARLQLQRATVLADVSHAAGVDRDAAAAALRDVGLDPAAVGDRPIDQLSGGQMRRVALAGLLAARPRVLVLDEPLAGLDLPTRDALCAVLADLRSKRGMTLVVISHDLEGMAGVCDRVIRLDAGRLVEDRPFDRLPELYGPLAGGTEAGVTEAGAAEAGVTGVDDAAAGVVPDDGVVGGVWAVHTAAAAALDGPAKRGSDGTASGAPAPAPAPEPRSLGSELSSRFGRRGSRRRRRPVSMVLLRQVPGDSPIHRLWAGTKLLAVTALSLTLSFEASWSATALLAGVVAVAIFLARIPWRAAPRLPRIFWLVMLLGALLTLRAGGKPYVHVLGGRVGLGDLDSFALFLLLSVVIFVASLMIGWTTSVADIAPAVARLCRPLRWFRLPVDEWAITLSLCIRSFPLLLDELRVLVAARRLRPRLTDAQGRRDLMMEGVDLFSASMVSALRRADEMGDAIRSRGGMGTLSARRSGPTRRDAVALVIVVCACVGSFFLPT
jgi:energy-coupling factor transport system ATP-binding protein